MEMYATPHAIGDYLDRPFTCPCGREHYAALSAHAGDCIECGACETRCPFAVAIRENMRSAKAVFGY